MAIVVEAAAGGVAVHLADLIPGLARRDVDVHLIAPCSGERFDAQWLTPAVLACCRSVTRVSMRREVGPHDLVSYLKVYRALANIRPDVVHAHSSKAGVLARVCIGPWRTLYTPHAVYTLNPVLGWRSRLVFGLLEGALGRWLTKCVIAVSDDEALHLHDVLRIPRARIATVWNGVPAFVREPRTDARRCLGARDDAFVVGMVGRFAFQKGVDRLIRVARRVAAVMGERIQFVCIGNGDFLDAAGIAADDVPANVHVVGEVADARRYFDAFDLLALPSRYEGFPYVYLEAVAAGVPVVSARVAGADVLVSGYETGTVVENTDDPAPFADAIVALANDPSQLARLRSNCAAAAAHFTAERMVNETFALCQPNIA